MKYYDKLIFELSSNGRKGHTLPVNDYPSEYCLENSVPVELLRDDPAELPQVSEPDVVRHYTNLSQMNFGVDTGFYPLGSCTMKYNRLRLPKSLRRPVEGSFLDYRNGGIHAQPVCRRSWRAYRAYDYEAVSHFSRRFRALQGDCAGLGPWNKSGFSCGLWS